MPQLPGLIKLDETPLFGATRRSFDSLHSHWQHRTPQRIMRTHYRISILTLLGFAVLDAGAQAGSLDPTFGSSGIVTTDVDQVQNYGYGSVMQPDGKIVVVGGSYGPVDTVFTVLRYAGDGALDPTFGAGGIVQLNFNGLEAQGLEIALQTDGRIVVGGIATGTNYDFGLARLMPDGSLDSSFDGDGYMITNAGPSYDLICSVLVQPDGRILIAGIAFSPGANSWAIMRFEADGSPDTTFGTNGIASEPADTATTTLPTAMALQPDGKILMAGRQGSAGTEDFGLTRRNADGTPDLSFGNNGWAIWDINSTIDQPGSLLIQPDGKIILCGVSTMNIAPFDWGVTLLRCDSDGSLDNGFGLGGIVTNPIAADYIPSVKSAFQQDGKIVTVAQFNDSGVYKIILQRHTPTGGLDPTFDLDGSVITVANSQYNFANDVLVQPDQRILVTGSSGLDILLLRYLNDIDIGVAEFNEGTAAPTVFPNPVGDHTSFSYDLSSDEHVSLTALDGAGRTVCRFLADPVRSQGHHMEELDLSGLAAGQYTLVLSNGKGATSVRVQKL